MNRRGSLQQNDPLSQLKKAERELEELNQQLRSFEALVDKHLGSLLDQLSELNQETAALDAQLRHIREERLYGRDLMSYQQGAPQPKPSTKLDDLPPLGISHRHTIRATVVGGTAEDQNIPDIKVLYRRLARRYHPDLARSEADRATSNEQMAEINQAYHAGDLKGLMRLAGISLPYGVELAETQLVGSSGLVKGLSDKEQAEWKLKAIRQQITRMSNLPIVRLSLEVKLAQHQGRNLLREMAADLRYKVGRKIAERDYLKAQIQVSGKLGGEENYTV
jgi:hypothetical protein